MLAQKLRNTLLRKVTAALIVGLLPLSVAAEVVVHAIQTSAWVQQGDSIRILNPGDRIDAGELVVTGDQGRIEIRDGNRLSLQQNTSTEIFYRLDESGNQPALLIQTGKACIQVHRAAAGQHRLSVALGTTMTVNLHNEGHICVLHQDNLSSVHLRDGSVQINHSVDSNIIVLSESGSEFQIESGESYSLLLPEVGHVLQIASEGFPIPEALQQRETVATEIEPIGLEEASVAGETTAESADPSPEPATAAVEAPAPSDEFDPEFIYTVYLFSTTDNEVADNVNRRFQRAGHASEIVTTVTGGTTRYRIVVTGFDSSTAARQFSDSVIGTLGISDTWIGHNPR